MLLDAEAEVSVLGEVLSPQLVLLHLQSSLQDLLSLNNTRVSWGNRKKNPTAREYLGFYYQYIWEFLIIAFMRKMVMSIT